MYKYNLLMYKNIILMYICNKKINYGTKKEKRYTKTS